MRKVDLKTIANNYCTDVALPDIDLKLLDKAFIQPTLLNWYKQNRRKMPWRGDQTSISPSAYGTWISEVMLQQTRVETVIDYWNRWMTVFPDVKTLANASPDEVNKLWAGLGYYRRAQLLLKGAIKVVEDYNGVLPDTTQELLKIPGIGPYTAGAIASIAYDKAEPLVDGNVMRVFSRLLAMKLEVGGGAMEKQCWKIATELVPTESPGDFNQALMELGATVCKPTSPDCGGCPLSAVCHAKLLVDAAKAHDVTTHKKSPEDTPVAGMLKLFAKKRKFTEKEDTNVDTLPDIEEVAGPAHTAVVLEELGCDMALLPREVTEFPRKVLRKKAKELTYSVCVLRTLSLSHSSIDAHNESTFRYLFVRRPATGLLANQWEFPSIHVAVSNNEEANVDDDEKEELEVEATSAGPTAADLWAPFLTYFPERLSMEWTGGSEKKQEKKEKAGTHTKKESSLPTLNTILVETAVHEAFEPIVHIFSHQRHTMHVTLRDVQVVERAEPALKKEFELKASEQEQGKEEVNEDITPSAVVSKWMTAAEIVEAGITTGCKKILTQVIKGKPTSTTASTTTKAKKVAPGGAKAATKKASTSKTTKVESIEECHEVKMVQAPASMDQHVVEIIDTDDEEIHTAVKQTPKNAFDLMKRASTTKGSATAPAKKRTKK